MSVAEGGKELCVKLPDLSDPQSSLLLLRHCHVTEVNRLASTVPPNVFLPVAQIHDKLTQETFPWF